MIRLLALTLTLSLALPAVAQNAVAITNAKIYTVSGKVIEKGTVLVRDGKIAAVGETVDLSGEYDIKKIDGTGMVVVPGLVTAHTYSGTDAPNENLPNTPFVSTIDSVDPSSLFFESQLRNGVTTVGVFPGNRQPIAGKGVIVKIRTKTVVGMLVRRDAGLKISLNAGAAVRRSRMWCMAQIRGAFEKAVEAREKHAEAEKKAAEAKKKNPKANVAVKPIDFKVQPLLDAIDGKLPAFVHCTRPGDVLRTLELAKTYPKMRIKLILGESAFKAHAAIKAAGLRVILAPGLEHRRYDAEADREQLWPIASVLHKAGIEMAFSPVHRARTLVTGHLWFQGAVAVKWGLKTDAALKAVTLWPAKTLGLDKRIGSIEVGKDGDLVLLSGEPFRIKTFVDRVLIDGKQVYHRAKDPWQDRLYYREKTQR